MNQLKGNNTVQNNLGDCYRYGIETLRNKSMVYAISQRGDSTGQNNLSNMEFEHKRRGKSMVSEICWGIYNGEQGKLNKAGEFQHYKFHAERGISLDFVLVTIIIS